MSCSVVLSVCLCESPFCGLQEEDHLRSVVQPAESLELLWVLLSGHPLLAFSKIKFKNKSKLLKS